MTDNVKIALPEWLCEEYKKNDSKIFVSDEERMSFAIELSKKNIKTGGGPFGAAVFDDNSGELLSVGVNLVMPLGLSIAHAEVVALIFAQKKVSSFNLEDGKKYQLVTSAQPCAQCLGAIVWSGVKRVISGADKDDVEKIGFDEGPVVEDWKSALDERGIQVSDRVLREDAKNVLADYIKIGGGIYNG